MATRAVGGGSSWCKVCRKRFAKSAHAISFAQPEHEVLFSRIDSLDGCSFVLGLHFRSIRTAGPGDRISWAAVADKIASWTDHPSNLWRSMSGRRNTGGRLVIRLLSAGFLVLAWSSSNGLAQQSFSCPIGREPACLEYGAKVCSSLAKCVDESASCFRSSTCDYNGFMCVSDHDDYVKKAKAMASAYDDFKSCVARSSDMDGVQSCVRSDNLRLP